MGTEEYGEYSVDDETQLQPGDTLDQHGVDDVLDEGFVTRDGWSPGQGFGNTPAEEHQGESWEQRLAPGGAGLERGDRRLERGRPRRPRGRRRPLRPDHCVRRPRRPLRHGRRHRRGGCLGRGGRDARHPRRVLSAASPRPSASAGRTGRMRAGACAIGGGGARPAARGLRRGGARSARPGRRRAGAGHGSRRRLGRKPAARPRAGRHGRRLARGQCRRRGRGGGRRAAPGQRHPALGVGRRRRPAVGVRLHRRAHASGDTLGADLGPRRSCIPTWRRARRSRSRPSTRHAGTSWGPAASRW